MRNRLVWLVSAMLLAACGGTGGTASSSPSSSSLSGYINVFAAASLTASFNALGISFHRAHPGVGVSFNYAGTPTLVTQIEQGAPADVFASADTDNMTKLTTDGFTSGASKVFARNQLEIVVAPGNPKGITGLADLAKPGLIYISEGPTVPAGK
jgi:molybdate transport system substrate-binding protein